MALNPYYLPLQVKKTDKPIENKIGIPLKGVSLLYEISSIDSRKITPRFLVDYSAYLPLGEKKIQNTILFNNRVAIVFAGCLN